MTYDDRPQFGPGAGIMGNLGQEPVDYSKYATINPGSSSMVNLGGNQQPFTFGQNAGNGFQMQMPSAPNPAASLGGGWSWLGGKNEEDGSTTNSGLMFGLGALKAGAGFYLGNEQRKLAGAQFDEAKRQFGKNFGASVKSYNTNIKDRQDRRYSGAGGDAVASNPYQQTDVYMKENRMVG